MARVMLCLQGETPVGDLEPRSQQRRGLTLCSPFHTLPPALRLRGAPHGRPSQAGSALPRPQPPGPVTRCFPSSGSSCSPGVRAGSSRHTRGPERCVCPPQAAQPCGTGCTAPAPTQRTLSPALPRCPAPPAAPRLGRATPAIYHGLIYVS